MLKIKHFFFDLDGTLSPSKQTASAEMLYKLKLLSHDRDVIVVSGSKSDQISLQLPNIKKTLLGQNGNHAIDNKGIVLWDRKIDESYKKYIYSHIESIKGAITYTIPDNTDLIEDRGAQISFSIYGHNAPISEKEKIDPDRLIRKNFLKQYPFDNDFCEVSIGGTTCFDYTLKNYNKGKNIMGLIEHYSWDYNECVFFGDALFPGGNDESVIGIVKTIEVIDEVDTLNKISKFL